MIIVTGSTGFLGSHMVCSLLQAGHTVCGLKRNKSSLQEFNYIFSYRFKNLNDQEKTKLLQQLSWCDGDLNDVLSLEEAFRGAEEVYHCAAMVSFQAKDQEQMNHVNVDGTANVVNAALLCGVKKLCYISSIAALGRTKSGQMIDEKTHWDESPYNSNYAISKHKAEMEVWRGIEEGLNAVIVNPGVIMGVGDWNKGSVNMLKIVAKGLPFYSTGVNGYVDVEDVAKAAILLMERKLFAQRYILVSENISVKDFFETAAKELGKKAPYIKVNKLLAEIAWRVMALKKILTGKQANITKETARASLNQYFYNNQKVKEVIQIDFKPVKQTIAEACKQLINQEKQSILHIMKKTILLLSLTATLFACKNTTDNSNDNKLLFEKSMAVKDYQSAIVAIQYMLLKDSTLAMYEDTLPELYVATSNIEAADYYTNRVLVRKPNDERFLQIKALCAQQKGKIEEEFDIYNKLFASTKKLSYLYQITAFQFSTGQMEQAVKNLAELETKATPKDSVDFAVSETEKQKVPLRAAVYNMKAYMQAQSRDLMGAKKYFEMAIKEYPDFVMAKRNLQQLMQGGRQ